MVYFIYECCWIITIKIIRGMIIMETKRNNILLEVNLKNHKDFVKVDNIHYGGYQGWLSSGGYVTKFWSNKSCGVIAAANTLFYMARNNPHNKSKNPPIITKENYLDLALYLYKFIKPNIYGIPTVSTMIKGLKNYAESMNFEITPFLLVNPTTLMGTVEYIKHGLKRNFPIMMVTWNTRITNLAYHWVTITGYYVTSQGKHYIVTSNWGKEEEFSLDEWFEEKSLYKGLLYFLTSNVGNID